MHGVLEWWRETWTTFGVRFSQNFLEANRWRLLADGLVTTVEITIGAVLVGLVIGFLVAVVRTTHDKTGRWRFLNFLAKVFLTVIRGTPTVVQILIIYFVIFASVNVPKLLVAILAFGINSGAYTAEIIRAGLMSIDKGQYEAGSSLGLNYSQTMTRVIVPQAFKTILPALGNELIVLLKETSISGYIAMQDLTKGGDIIRSQTYDAFMPLMAVAAIYLACVCGLSWCVTKMERRLKRNE